jgi:peptidoglycan hydrolase-like protein with peptidoglycan-binding domain
MAQRGWVIPTSGTFDARGDEVCRKFQDEKGLVVDGKVGPITWKATWTTPVTRGEPAWPEESEELPWDESDELPWDGDDDRGPSL